MARLEDVVAVANPVLAHRVITSFAAESENITSTDIVNRLIEELSEGN
jgi:MoxR-like ATPase